ncbi:MAG: hypothetical protein ACFFDI_06490 [Promethearchaeota archaeon]
MREFNRVVIDSVNRNGTVWCSVYDNCDHSTEGLFSALFRISGFKDVSKIPVIKWADNLQKNQYYKERKPELKPGYMVSVKFDRMDKGFLHGVREVVILSRKLDVDWLLDL